MTEPIIQLAQADADDIADFKKELQDAFAVAVVNEMKEDPGEPIPSDEELDASFNAQGAVTLRILCEGRKIGGAVVSINDVNRHNSLDLFFLKLGEEGRGLGHKAWLAIEKLYPETRVWQTFTPYFEKRNIHFYVNKCGFKIIEFFNSHHPDPSHPVSGRLPVDEGFLFEKVM
ncbi:N-acetyltransferase [Allorhizobium sp. BGMRC 0089]|uniref:N-acetyltransferase n=1 Tax=Allorhizobium sonneratiae TaxID=2934936 RepID=UPI0020331D24|nr:N-acetyltransferase [Allorhizobium sonneratiae]MCM2292499.1 N-acetyltransferase [Allorhizobium sonneratiae]